MDWLYQIGRVLFVMVFIGSGLGQLAQTNAMAQYAESKSVGAAKTNGYGPFVMGSPM